MFLHSFDDRHLLSGYSSMGEEILEDCPDVDVVLVCCGGGGLVSGVAAYLKKHSKKKEQLRIYAVEPENANCMYLSVQVGCSLYIKDYFFQEKPKSL